MPYDEGGGRVAQAAALVGFTLNDCPEDLTWSMVLTGH
jgi:hypothetical protein